MPTIQQIIQLLESVAPPIYQESYDNAGLITGNRNLECSGALLTLDSTPEVVQEAIDNGCNLIIAHHPILFRPIKSITGKSYVEQALILAIKHDIALYAAHTNLDNMVVGGVSARMAQKLKLTNCEVLEPKPQTLQRLVTFVPEESAEIVRQALFFAGAGSIGQYSQCSFNSTGVGSFLGSEHSNPTVGTRGVLEHEEETKIEVLVSIDKINEVIKALKTAHPYEEVAYYQIPLENLNQDIGAGVVGNLSKPMDELEFLNLLKSSFSAPLIRHTSLLGKPISRVALCGGSGSFLLPRAKQSGAQIFVTADFKYHEFFDAENQLIIADIGHYESEQYTTEIFHEIIDKKFPNFALRFSDINTNPINYF